MTRGMLLVGLLAAALVVTGISGAMAQTARGELKNISALKFRGASLNEASARCGLEEAALETAFTDPLVNAGLKIVDSSGYWFSLRVTSLTHGERLCVSYVEATLFQNTRYFNSATLQERAGRVFQWNQGGLRASDKEDHAARVKRALRNFASKFVDDWQKDR